MKNIVNLLLLKNIKFVNIIIYQMQYIKSQQNFIFSFLFYLVLIYFFFN